MASLYSLYLPLVNIWIILIFLIMTNSNSMFSSASPLSHVSSPFCCGYFGDRVLLFAQASLDFDLLKFPALPGMTGMHYRGQLFSIEMGSCKLVAGDALKG
jgi:hypothetical protein